MSESGETVILERDGVTITTKRAVIQGTTYPIASLSAVSLAKVPAPVGCMVITALGFGVGGLVMTAAGVAGGTDASMGFTVFGLTMLVAMILVAVMIRRARGTYVVRLHTAGLQTDALKSNDADLANAINSALNEAIIRRA
jgi:hypothetical protein